MKIFLMVLGTLVILGALALFLLYTHPERLVTGKIESFLKASTGVPVTMEGLVVNPASKDGFMVSALSINQINVSNPAGFKNPQIAQIKDVKIIFDFLPFLLGKWNIRQMNAFFEEIYIEKNAQGEINLSALPALSEASLEKSAPRARQKRERKFFAQRIEFKWGTLYYAEPDPANAVEEPDPEKYELGENAEVYDYVTAPELILQIPALKVLATLNKGSLGVPRGKIQENISNQMGQAE